MAGKIRFHHRVFVALLVLCGLLVACFVVFQYQRERHFKSELLDMQLQMHNARIIDDLRRGDRIEDVVARIGTPIDELRVTLVDSAGHVVFDNASHLPQLPSANHNSRPEITGARRHGTGYIVGRKSESDDTEYFYSAMLGDDGLVVRSAAPYGHSLEAVLRADRTFLWIMLGVTLAVGFIGYFVSRRISQSIKRLNLFAEKARKGEAIFDDGAFPDDELGGIASNIVRLYVQRDMQHREAMAQERDKTRLKKQLTNNINHELKTPVSSIVVCSDLLIDHPALDEAKHRELVERIHDNATRLKNLLGDVSTITRMDDGAANIAKEPVDLVALVRGVAGEFELLTDMPIVTDMPERVVVNANRQLAESVFRNLIDNAVNYSHGTEIRIMIDSRGRITVRDNGTGIAEEHMPHIFERFYRVDSGRSRSLGGTGLGLSIVRNAVAIHGGTITATNNNGLQLDFTLGDVIE